MHKLEIVINDKGQLRVHAPAMPLANQLLVLELGKAAVLELVRGTGQSQQPGVEAYGEMPLPASLGKVPGH